MGDVIRDTHGRWAGSGNPAGRPIGSRQKLAEQFIRDAFELWKREGPASLVQMRKEDNTKFCQMMAGLIPRDLVLTVEAEDNPLASLTPDEKRAIAHKLMEQLASERAKQIDAEVLSEHVSDADKSLRDNDNPAEKKPGKRPVNRRGRK
jgi:hypothetical protein